MIIHEMIYLIMNIRTVSITVSVFQVRTFHISGVNQQPPQEHNCQNYLQMNGGFIEDNIQTECPL